MRTCDWCESLSNELMNYEGSRICKECYNKATVKHVCRECGVSTPKQGMINGLCSRCFENSIKEKAERRERASLGIASSDMLSTDLVFTEDDYNKWVTYDPNNKGFSPEDFKKSTVLRRLWIMTKLKAAGITDEDVINDNMEDIEYIIDKNFSKLINNKCKIVIITKMSDRRGITQCIGFRKRVYICKV